MTQGSRWRQPRPTSESQISRNFFIASESAAAGPAAPAADLLRTVACNVTVTVTVMPGPVPAASLAG